MTPTSVCLHRSRMIWCSASSFESSGMQPGAVKGQQVSPNEELGERVTLSQVPCTPWLAGSANVAAGPRNMSFGSHKHAPPDPGIHRRWRAEDLEQRALENARALWNRNVEQNRRACVSISATVRVQG